MMRVMRKKPSGLSHCHTKTRMGARDTDFSEFDSAEIIDYFLEKSVSCHARPSFFWYDNNKDLKVCFLVTRVLCELSYNSLHTQRHHPT